MTKIEAIIQAAQSKFGEVKGFKPRENSDITRLGILRDRPTFADAPYMTISAYTNEKAEVCFINGAYDITEAAMLKEVA